MSIDSIFRQALARRHFLDAIPLLRPDYLIGECHRQIANRLTQFQADCAARKRPRLILTMPPRHGKSSLMEMFVAWCIGKVPSTEIIITSFSQKQATDRVIKAKEIALEQAVHPINLSKDVRSKIDWRVTDERGRNLGGCYAAGRGSAMNGLGADMLNFDDLVKDLEDARSQGQMDKIWAWLQTTAMRRLSPTGGALMIGTRWSLGDIIGRCLNTGRWELMEFPAIATHIEGWRREGDPLHPERWPLDALEDTRAEMTTADWETLYQCNPIPTDSVVWNPSCINHYTVLPAPLSKMRLVWAWDFSFGSLTGSRVSGVLIGAYEGKYYLIEEVCRHMSITAAVAELEKMAAKYPNAINIVEEAAGGWTALEQAKARVRSVTPKGSKITRAQGVQWIIEKGLFYVPESFVDYFNEITVFPQGRRDDRVDTTAYGLKFLSKGISI